MFPCKECDRVFTTPGGLAQHVLAVHPNDSIADAVEHREPANADHHFSGHIPLVITAIEPSYRCGNCGFGLTELPDKCPYCQQEFVK